MSKDTHLVIRLLKVYLLAIIILIHCALFFCNQPHCVLPIKTPPFSADVVLKMNFAMKCLPFGMKTAQLIAQWIVLAQILVLLYYCIKLARVVISLMCEIIFVGVLLAIAYRVYIEYQSNPEGVRQQAHVLVEWAISKAYQIWGWLQNELNKK